jgi:uncharacterized protein YdhG (YjbR/CyaY superfamily)
MKPKQRVPATVDEYLADFPPEVRKILRKIRATIRKAAPGVKEKISYRIPTFTLDGDILIYFAAFTKHASIYPAPRGAEEFRDELAGYRGGKGTVQFPLDQPIPYGLITRIVKFRARHNRAKAKAKGKTN